MKADDSDLCTLTHRDGITRLGAVKITIASNRAHTRGRPLVREYLVCRGHAKELRTLGMEVVK